MTKIPYPNLDESPEKVLAFFDKMRTNSGGAEIMNIFRMASYSSASIRELIRLGSRLLTKAHLDERWRELAILRIAQMLGARYEWAQHVPIAVGVGISKEQIREIENWGDSTLLDEKDKIILKFTEEVVTGSRPTDGTFETASQFLDDESLVELTLSIGYWSMIGKFLKTFQVDVEPHFMEAHSELLDFTGMIDL